MVEKRARMKSRDSDKGGHWNLEPTCRCIGAQDQSCHPISTVCCI